MFKSIANRSCVIFFFFLSSFNTEAGTYYIWGTATNAVGTTTLDTITITVVEPVKGISLKDNSIAVQDTEKGTVIFTASINVNAIMGQFNGSEYIQIVDKSDNTISGDSMVGTGSKVKLVQDGVMVDEVTMIVKGDVDGDGSVTIADVQTTYLHMMSHAKLDGVYVDAAKVKNDATVSILDIMSILNMIV